MKKFLLVPSQSQSLPPTPLARKLGELDSEMKSIFDRTDLDEYEKAMFYSNTLDKYMAVKEKMMKPTPIPLVDEKTPTVNKQHTTPSIDMDMFPTSYRKRAQNLLNHIQRNTSLGWNSRNELTVDSIPVEGSNIVDLVDDAVRFKKRPSPTGSQSFTERLLNSNVPKSLIGNKHFFEKTYDIPPPSPLDVPTRTRIPRPTTNQLGKGSIQWLNL